MDTLVSIIVPTFNRAKLLVEAIESIQKQSYENWELLVVDDGSSDDTEAVMCQFRGDPRIHYLKQKNRGQAAARNLGISRATGELVAFLDSDNRWLPHKLKIQTAFMDQHPDVDILYGEIEMLVSSGRTQPASDRARFSGIVWKELLVDNFVNFNTSVVRREKLAAVGGMDDRVRRGDDYDLWLRLAPSCRFHFLPGVVAQYRVEGSRISDDVDGRLESNMAAVERFLELNPGLLASPEIKQTRAKIYGRFARAFSASGRFARGIALAIRAIALAPLSRRAWRTFLAVLIGPFRKGARTASSEKQSDGA